MRVNGRLLLGATQKEACDVFVSIPIGEAVDIQVCRGYELFIDPTNRVRNYQRIIKIIELVPDCYWKCLRCCQEPGSSRNRHLQGIRGIWLHDSRQCERAESQEDLVSIAMPQSYGRRHDCRTRWSERPSDPAHATRRHASGTADRISRQAGREERIPEDKVTHAVSCVPIRRTDCDRLDCFCHSGKIENSSWKTAIKDRRRAVDEEYVTKSELIWIPGNNDINLFQQPAVTSEWEGMNGATVSRMRPSSTTLGFATPNYIPLSQYTQKPSDLITVSLIRKPVGFGFRLLGGVESKTPLSVGQIVIGGAAEEDGRLHEGDEIVEIDGHNVEGASHSEAVVLLEAAAQNKHVKLVVRRPSRVEAARRGSLNSTGASASYDVLLHRNDNDGFGFVLMSSHNRNGSTVGQIQPGSPAARCGRLAVGDRVVAVNGMDILNMAHPDIIALIKDSGLSVRLTIAPSDSAGPVLPMVSATLGRNFTMNGTHFESNYGLPPPPPSVYEKLQPPTYLPFDSLSINDRMPMVSIFLLSLITHSYIVV